MAARSNNSTTASLESLSRLTGGGVIVDIGTGDGRFVYESAKENPEKFFIGIDPNTKPLEKVSMKATRKPMKGGVANVLFVRAAIEELPSELDNTADEIHIHFPWGSLLGGIVDGDERILRSLHRISAPGCLLEVVIGFDRERDRRELERLGISKFSLDYVRNTLVMRYEAARMKVKEVGVLEKGKWTRLHSSWARRLSSNDAREVVYFIAEAQK
ncbi:MAG TPA: methyltransferase domain-containing protein [Pyrinomonadaceae bacterium]|nr:methyltransferase domain-containing protein [Pyrinomonadaceae bacterium]